MTEEVVDLEGVVRLGLKLIGLGLVVYGAVTLPGYVTSLASGGGFGTFPMQAMAFLTGPVLAVMFGLFLWLFPSPVVNTVIHKRKVMSDGNQDWSGRLEVVGMSLLGVWLLYRAVSDLVFHSLMHFQQAGSLAHAEGFSELGAALGATLVEFVLALFLLFGARGISRFVRRLRYGGID